MKATKNQPVTQPAKLNNNKKRPDIRDTMDSREGEEQDDKGDDTTHNKKEVKNKKSKS